MSRLLSGALLSALMLSLCACSVFSSSDSQGPGLSPAPAYLCDAQPGESAKVDDPEYGGEVTVRYEASFTLVDGSRCRRGTVIVPRRSAELLVVCTGSDGYWHVAPQMWGIVSASPAEGTGETVLNSEILPADR